VAVTSARGPNRMAGRRLRGSGGPSGPSSTVRASWPARRSPNAGARLPRKGLESVGIFLAEGFRPLSRLAGQGLHFLTPHLGLVFGDRRVSNLACLLEDPNNLERIASRLEELEERRGRSEGDAGP